MDPTLDAQRYRDGRNVDPALGTLSGEAAGQRAHASGATAALALRTEGEPPTDAIEGAQGPSYYGLPLLKEPVWTWEIPAYFFTGGLAGACAVLGAAAQAAGGRGSTPLVRRCRLVAVGGAAVSAALLIDDLGRPARFLAMLRVFRPTSPMNMGTWVLSGFGALSAAAALPSVLPAARRYRRTTAAAGYGAGLLGLPLVGYTGVLLANTAVPVWQATRNTLPVLFAFSGAVSAGALLQLWGVPGPGQEMARRFGLVAKGAELALSRTMHREAAVAPAVERPLSHGRSGVLLKAARACLVGSAVLDLWPGRSRARRVASGALGILGTLAIRFGIVDAGRASARDPHATFAMQRAGRGAAELARKQEQPEMPSLPGVDATGKETAHHAGAASP